MKVVTAISVLSFLSQALMAQGPSGPPGPPSSTTGPVDSGILLMILGVALWGYSELKRPVRKPAVVSVKNK